MWRSGKQDAPNSPLVKIFVLLVPVKKSPGYALDWYPKIHRAIASCRPAGMRRRNFPLYFPRGNLPPASDGASFGGIVKQYRPNVERQKELYSRMKAREIFRRMSGRTRVPGAWRIPDNSEPWLPDGVHSVADALYISDRIKEDIARWQNNNLPTI